MTDAGPSPMPDAATDLIERLDAAPHWQTAIQRAQSLARTDARARAWIEGFLGQAHTLVEGIVPRRPATGRPGAVRFVIGSAGLAIPPELTAILRDALGGEGPVLRAAVFLLVGAAVRAPLVPNGAAAPWDTYEKLRMIARALPAARRERWCQALPPSGTDQDTAPTATAGRRLIAQGFGHGFGHAATARLAASLAPLPRPETSLPAGASLDLLLSALTFRACTELADRAANDVSERAA